MARLRQDEVLQEVGLDTRKVAASACRVFNGVTKAQLDPAGNGWLAVAEFAAAMFAARDDDSQVTFASFAEMLRKAFARVEAPGKELAPFEQLKPLARLAWEGVARHVGFCFNIEREQVKHLARFETRMAAFALRGFRE
jgi:hypothetical protein